MILCQIVSKGIYPVNLELLKLYNQFNIIATTSNNYQFDKINDGYSGFIYNDVKVSKFR